VQKVKSFLPVNTVLTQYPAAGTHAALGGGVKLVVSDGKGEPVVVPDVVGLDEARAVARIEEAKLHAAVRYVDVTARKEDGVALEQTPPGGRRLDPGSTVVLRVGRLPSNGDAANVAARAEL
jgi:beta-lactam-binding protein with PASTA domain